MKIQFVKSIDSYLWDGDSPISKQEHRGKASRVRIGEERSIMLILPCGHTVTLHGWHITGVDTDTPSASPSIFCQGKLTSDGKPGPCWHGWLTDGKLISV